MKNMVSAKEYISGGEFISPKDFDDPFRVVIVSEPVFVEKEFEDKKVEQLVCEVENKALGRKRLAINKTNAKELAGAWGDETAVWVGKVLEVGKIRVSVAGEKRWGLDLCPVLPKPVSLVREEEVVLG